MVFFTATFFIDPTTTSGADHRKRLAGRTTNDNVNPDTTNALDYFLVDVILGDISLNNPCCIIITNKLWMIQTQGIAGIFIHFHGANKFKDLLAGNRVISLKSKRQATCSCKQIKDAQG